MKIIVKELPVKELFPGFDARMIHTDNATVTFVDIAKGSRLPTHRHVQEQITYIVKGTLEMMIGETTLVLSAGDAHVITSNTPHNAHALSDCLVMDFFTPARDDYR